MPTGGVRFGSGLDDVQIGQFANRADALAQILGCGRNTEKPPVGHLDQGGWAVVCTDAPFAVIEAALGGVLI